MKNDSELIREHANELRKFLTGAQAPPRPHESDLAARALGRIESTVEELKVAEEELRVQHEELVAANMALEAERERYIELFENAPDPYLETDENAVIRTANRAAAALFGLRSDRLEGKPLLVYIPISDHPTFFEQLEKIRTVHDSLPATFEIGIVSRLGPMRVMQARVDTRGRNNSIRWLLRDMTDARRAEEAQRQIRMEHAMRVASEASVRQERFLSEAGETLSEQLKREDLHDLVTRIPIPYLADACALDIIDTTRTVKRVSSYSGDDDNMIERLVPADSTVIEEVLATGESQVITGDPKEKDRATCLVMRLAARGRMLGVLSIARSDPERSCGRDIMVAQAYAQRVSYALDNVGLYEDAANARNIMADTVRVLSHEFRTPLSSVLGYADLMLAGIPGTITDQQREYLGSVRSSAWHLGRLVDDVLAGSRAAERVDAIDAIKVNVSALVDDIASVITPESKAKGIEVSTSRPSDLEIITDLVKLRQILMNLAGNAVKFTKHGVIRIEAAARMGGVQIDVVDTGPGIQPDDVLRVFDDYWQGRNASLTGGVGLGLALSRRLARALGGDIVVESEENHGTRFTLWIPGLG